MLSADNISSLLDNLLELLNQFIISLESENEGFVSQNAMLLENAITQKKDILSKIELETDKLVNLLHAHQLQFSPNDLNVFFTHYDLNYGHHMKTKWHQITQLISKSNRFNTRNGLIVNMLKAHNDVLLNFLVNNQSQPDYSDMGKKQRSTLSTREHKA